MKTYFLFILVQFYCIYIGTSIKIKPELKRNILNYKFEGMLVHLLDRFYMVTKLIYHLLEIWTFQN